MQEASQTPDQLLAYHLQRLNACHLTIAAVHSEIFDPLTPDKRADLLIQVEDVANAAVALALEVRELIWPPQTGTPFDDHIENRKAD